jgi:hypothetical protein
VSIGAAEARYRMLGLLAALRRLTTTLASAVEASAARAVAAYRMELRRAAFVLALSLAAALLGFASFAFAALAVMIAFWPTHPVIASAVLAFLFAASAFVAVLLIRGRTQAPPSPERG